MLLPFGTSMTNISNAIAITDENYKSKIDCDNINTNLNGIKTSIGIDNALGVGEGATASIQGDGEEVSTNTFGNEKEYTNDGNFELDCINNNDNEGIGQQGPRGPAGPQGPSGIN